MVTPSNANDTSPRSRSENAPALAVDPVAQASVLPGSSPPDPPARPPAACFHCGTPCPEHAPARAGKSFCCHGCLTVYEILIENNLGHFYDLNPQAGVRVARPPPADRFAFLDDPAIREQLLDFADATTAQVTLELPAIHCIACVWLLENLFQLRPGIGRSTVNFPRRLCTVTFDPRQVRLSEVAALLTALGYEPRLHLGTATETRTDPVARRLWLRTGVAGFAFGNTMLLSVAGYLGLSAAHEPALQRFFGYLSLLLALPVLSFSAADYWRAAWLALRRRVITIELPIAIGLLALFGQSAFTVLTQHGEHYLDSLTGLVFFLLCGRLFQHKTFDRLAFDRDYRSFLPLAVLRRTPHGDQTVPLSRIAVGDHLWLRHGELIPTDARLTSGQGLVDYSFVTGEASPVAKQPGDLLHAGGRQVGSAIEVETVKPISQNRLTDLWSHAAFRPTTRNSLDNLTNRFSRRFTFAVLTAALATAAWWTAHGDGDLALRAAIAVLIVACPCALALAAPFALGTAQRLLTRHQVFLKNPQVLETLARVRTLVFDKTGTLTTPAAGAPLLHGPPLTDLERHAVVTLARHSTHPHAARLADALAEPWLGSGTADPASPGSPSALAVSAFREHPGAGLEGKVAGLHLTVGSAAWLTSQGVPLPPDAERSGVTHFAINQVHRGQIRVDSHLRPAVATLFEELRRQHHDLLLLSGDGERDRPRFRAWFPSDAHLRFQQTPVNKLEFIRELQQSGRTVMMVGDGLNDAGALRQSDVGVAVLENLGAFSPASDIILEAAQVPRLPAVLRLARTTVRVVHASFLLSVLYNVVGLSFAASGHLSPLVCAVLMPVSSVTVVAFACGATRAAARRFGLGRPPPPSPPS